MNGCSLGLGDRADKPALPWQPDDGEILGAGEERMDGWVDKWMDEWMLLLSLTLLSLLLLL